MILLICGGRDYRDYERVYFAVLELEPTTIVHGGARGADELAAAVANVLMIREVEFKAEWDRFGRSAGYIRNQQMLDEGQPNMVLAFPGGRGTANMIRIAGKAGVPVVELKEGGDDAS